MSKKNIYKRKAILYCILSYGIRKPVSPGISKKLLIQEITKLNVCFCRVVYFPQATGPRKVCPSNSVRSNATTAAPTSARPTTGLDSPPRPTSRSRSNVSYKKPCWHIRFKRAFLHLLTLGYPKAILWNKLSLKEEN